MTPSSQLSHQEGSDEGSQHIHLSIYARLTKIIHNYHQILPLIWSSALSHAVKAAMTSMSLSSVKSGTDNNRDEYNFRALDKGVFGDN